MSLWSVFLTGLFAGGLSCAAVQGGLLAGLLARRAGGETAPSRSAASPTAPIGRRGGPPATAGWADMLPVAGFLAGKLASHAALGAALGFIGDLAQPTPAARALLQVVAGVVMLVLAADVLGVQAVRRLVPQPPAGLARVVRRSGRAQGAATPALLGVATVLIPCGVTLGVELLAVASGSALAGAAMMATFVVGTSPLFAVLGYAARRSATALRGRLAPLAAGAVALAGLLSVNAGLALAGSPLTLGSVAAALTPGGEGRAEAAVPEAVVDGAGVQQIRIDVGPSSYTPSLVRARPEIPTRLVLRTDQTVGCTRSFVIPSLGLETRLPSTGETVLDLGALRAGTLRYTCGMGMYRGAIEVA